MAQERYRYQLHVDDLPSATKELHENPETHKLELEDDFNEGIHVGKHFEDGTVILYNHLAMTVKTH